MGHSQRITLQELGGLYDIANECRELWASPRDWQAHALSRLAAAARCRIGLCYEMADQDGVNADRILSAEDMGWESPGERRTFVLGVAHMPLRYSPLYVQFADALPDRQEGASLTVGQARLIDRGKWRRSEFYDHHVRPTRIGEGIMSAVWMSVSQTWSCWCLINDVSNGVITPRQEQLTGLLHRQIAGLIGTKLSTWRHQTVDAVAPARRQVLDGLLDGKSERQIADDGFRSHAAVHEHVTALYRHFNVTSRGELAARFLRRQPIIAAGTKQAPAPPLAGDAWLNRRGSPSPV